MRAAARTDVDAAAGQARLRYITDVAGQQAVYLIKREEATAYLAAVPGDAQAPVPGHIEAEALATGAEPPAVAQAVADLAAYWNVALSPPIEGARLGAKATIDAAADAEAVAAARDAGIAALGAL